MHIITDSFKIDPIDTSLLCTSLICSQKEAHPTLVSWREFGWRDDANAWRKSTKEADKHKNFYGNLENKNLSMHWRHHLTNSRQSTSEKDR